MTSLTNQQFNTKTMTGLSDTYSNNIVCDTLDVNDAFTCEPGCVITLPTNSISDSALSTNVAFKNQNNTFTMQNTFNDTLTISRTGSQLFIRDPANTDPSTISQTGNTLTMNAISGVSTTLLLQTRTASNVVAQVFSGNSTRVSLGFNTGIIDLRPLVCNIFGTTMTYPVAGTAISGGLLTFSNPVTINGSGIFGGACSFTNATTPVITQTIPTVDNSTKIATTAWVTLQNYITSASLTPYALLTSVPIQIFTGQNQFQNATLGNQILIKDTANSGPSTISQVGTSLNISSITNLTGFLRTNLVLSTRTSANAGCVLFNGNENALTLGQNSTSASITSPTVNLTGGNSFTASQATIGGTNVPKITIQPLIGSNTNEIASTKFVKDQLYITASALTPYAQLAGTQTFTGQNTFALSGLEVIMNGGCLFNDILLGGSSTIINQSGVVCSVANTHDLGSVTLSTRTSLGIPRDNVYALNGNQGGLRGNSGNTIDITGTQATIGGTSVPVITTQPLAPSNSNEIASTAWVINKAYATTASLSSYALLSADQTFTGTQTCVAASNVLPVKIQTQLVGYTGYSGGSLITDSGAYNGVNLNAGNYSVIAFGTGINTGGVLTLTTHSSTNCGIRITNTEVTQTVPFTCGYLQLGTPVTTKTNYQMGFINTILYAGFTGNAWATSSGAYNIMTIAWNGTGDYTLGVWNVEIVIISQCVTAPLISFTWNTLTATSMSLNLHSGSVSDMGAYAGVGASIFRMSFVLNVANLTTNYFLNCSRVGGTVLSSDSNSYIKFTRLG